MTAMLSSCLLHESGKKYCSCYRRMKSYVPVCRAWRPTLWLQSLRFPFQVTDYTDDTHILIYGYCTIFLQVVQNFIQMFGVINGYGNTDL